MGAGGESATGVGATEEMGGEDEREDAAERSSSSVSVSAARRGGRSRSGGEATGGDTGGGGVLEGRDWPRGDGTRGERMPGVGGGVRDPDARRVRYRGI